MSPKFKAGTKVLHRSTNKVGTVVLAFESGDGFRYYVDHSGFRWSIPEWALLLHENKPQ